MPLARVRIELYASTQQALTSARTAILSRYPAAGKIFDRNDGTIGQVGGQWTLTVDCRLKAKLDGDKLRDDIAAGIDTLRSFGVTGRVTYHQCTHNDANPEPCVPEVITV